MLQVITRMVRGGAQRILLDLVRRLPRDQFEITIAAGCETGSEGSLWDEAESLGVRLVRLTHLVRDVAPRRDAMALMEMRKLIARLRPQVVHTHTSKAGLVGNLAARLERVPRVIFSPHGHIAGAAIPGVPNRGLKRRLLLAGARYSSHASHLVVAPNEVERAEGVALRMWRADACVAINNGIDTTRFQPGNRDEARARMGLAQDQHVIGVVARLTREKGVDIALSALPHLPDSKLVILGDGPERASLETLAQALGVAARVTFVGFEADVAQALPAFDAVVVPSRYEAHGLVAAEALACGVPVAAARVGGLSAIIRDGVSGALFEAENLQDCARAVRVLMDTSQPDWRVVGPAWVKKHFSLEMMAERTAAVYLGSVQG